MLSPRVSVSKKLRPKPRGPRGPRTEAAETCVERRGADRGRSGGWSTCEVVPTWAGCGGSLVSSVQRLDGRMSDRKQHQTRLTRLLTSQPPRLPWRTLYPHCLHDLVWCGVPWSGQIRGLTCTSALEPAETRSGWSLGASTGGSHTRFLPDGPHDSGHSLGVNVVFASNRTRCLSGLSRGVLQQRENKLPQQRDEDIVWVCRVGSLSLHKGQHKSLAEERKAGLL